MLLGDMNICRPMSHAQHVEGDKLSQHAKENKNAKAGNYYYSWQKPNGGNHSQSQQKLSALAPSSASLPPSKNEYD